MKLEVQDGASVKGEDVEVKLESQSQQPEQPAEVAIKAEVIDDSVQQHHQPDNAPEEPAGPSGEAGIQQQHPQQQDRIQAYAKLQFPFFNFYIQKLSVTIGRRPPESRIPPKDEPLPPALNGNALEHEESKPAAAAAKDEGGDAEDVKETPAQGEEGHVNGIASVKPEQSSQQQADQQQPATEQISGHIPVEGEDVVAQAKHEEESQTRQTTPKKEEEASQTLRPATPTRTLLPEGQTLDIEPVASTSTLPTPPPPPQSTPGRFQGNKVQVDVDLGPIKAVSRDHARLFFDTNTHPMTGASNGWSIEVRGRNGLVLDGRWRAKDEVIKLTNRSKIQIAERIFYFVLPNGVPYPSAPVSPTMSNTYWDEHYMNDMNGYPQSPGRSPSPPLVYGSDSDELRSDDDMQHQRRGSSSMSTNSRSRNASNAPLDGQSEAIDPVTGKRKRGRPPKTRTAEEIEERNKRSDPSAPRRPRGRPPKHVPPEEPVEGAPATATDAPAAAKEAKKLSKKQLSEIKKAERERLKAEKAEAKEREKKEKEAIKEAAKAAKKAEKEKADKEKKEKDKEAKEKEAKEKAEKDRIAKEEEDKKKREAEEERRKILAEQQIKLQQQKHQQQIQQPTAAAVAPPIQLALPKPAPPASAAVIPGQIDQIPSWTPTNQFIGRPDQPPYSYAALIAQAIYATPHKQAQIGHIQSWIPDKYPYFREHAPMLQAAIRKDLAVNRAFVNIPLQSGIALWAVEPEQAKYFDGNTFLPPPTADPALAPTAGAMPSPALQSARLAPLASPALGASPSPQPPPTPAAPAKTPILISTLPPSYIKPSPTSSADPSSMLDPNGFPPIAIHEDKMYLSPSIFATLTAQQLSNLQTLDTKQALNILQAFVVNYFKTELKKRKKAEKAAAAAAASAQQNGTKRSAEDAIGQPSKVQKVA